MIDFMIPVGRCPICGYYGKLRAQKTLQVICGDCDSLWRKWYHMPLSKTRGDRLPIVINMSLKGMGSLIDSPDRSRLVHSSLINRVLNTAVAMCFELKDYTITDEGLIGNYRLSRKAKKRSVELLTSLEHLGLVVDEEAMMKNTFILSMLLWHLNLMRLLFSTHVRTEKKWLRAGCLFLEDISMTDTLTICRTALTRYTGEKDWVRLVFEDVLRQESDLSKKSLATLSLK